MEENIILKCQSCKTCNIPCFDHSCGHKFKKYNNNIHFTDMFIIYVTVNFEEDIIRIISSALPTVHSLLTWYI